MKIEGVLIELFRNLIRNKKFARYLIDKHYPIAIDGTQKCVRDVLWAEQYSERELKDGEGTKMQYYVNVLEANPVFANGMSIPLISEFSNYAQGDTGNNKSHPGRDEQKAFKRLGRRLKQEFTHLPVMFLLDGLYPNGPIIELCRKNKWDFMIVLKP